MEWKEIAKDFWEAKGEDGKFLLWKSGRQWTGRYEGTNKSFKLPFGSLRDIKKKCEENYYWEEK